MSRRHSLQDATGVIADKRPIGALIVTNPTTPTNAQAGFAPSCLWLNTNGALGSFLYVNTGTSTSSTWTNVV